MHPITSESPLFEMTKDDLTAGEAEVLILLQAFDDTFSQTVHSRASYIDESIIYNAKFTTIFHNDENGATTLDLSKLSTFERLS